MDGWNAKNYALFQILFASVSLYKISKKSKIVSANIDFFALDSRLSNVWKLKEYS